jgi:ribosomal protein S12 methylthiotransferase accessory factor
MVKIFKEYFLSFFRLGNMYSFAYNPHYPNLYYWQPVLNYLHSNQLISDPHFFCRENLNDEPRLYGFNLFQLKVVTDGYAKDLPVLCSSHFDDPDISVSKALGEFLERYFLLVYKRNKLIHGSFKELNLQGKNVLNPKILNNFSDIQKKEFKHFVSDEHSPFGWVEGYSLATKKKILIPAQLVFWTYKREGMEPLIRESNTNGASGHFTYEEAVLSGAYEVIQRDSFLWYWMQTKTPPRISHKSLTAQNLKRILENCKRYGLQVEIMDVTTNLQVPSFIVVILDTSLNGVAVAMGGGCGWNKQEAIHKAVVEALSVRKWYRTVGFKNKFQLPQDYKPFFDISVDHLNRQRLWAEPGTFSSNINFFISGKEVDLVGEERSFGDSKSELEHVLYILRSQNRESDIYVYEVKNKILDALGYHVVRVIIPTLIPLYLKEVHAPLTHPRLWEELGQDASGCENLINKLPHPFP